jgi:hypothetical protein
MLNVHMSRLNVQLSSCLSNGKEMRRSTVNPEMRIAFYAMRFRGGRRQNTSQITVLLMVVQVSTTFTSVGTAD